MKAEGRVGGWGVGRGQATAGEHRQTDRQTDRQKQRERERETETDNRDTDRQTDRQRECVTHEKKKEKKWMGSN